MGTRSITRIRQDNKVLVAIYRQFDGYFSGHGKDIYDLLNEKEIVNGMRLDADKNKIYNGPGCLAASIVAALKKGPGGVYIVSPDAEDEEYVYEININRTQSEKVFDISYSEPRFTIKRHDESLLENGTLEEFEYVINGGIEE